jgi:hypothetical protein
MIGGQYEAAHRPAAAEAAPAAAAEFAGGTAEFAETPFAIPGLSTDSAASSEAAVRRSATDPLGGSSVDAGTEKALQSPSGGGKLDESVKSRMESAFDTDFSDVRVHTGSSASKLSRSLQATAFTHGSNIYFSEGTYNPNTEGGQHLLAHELTHVVQRKQGRDTGAPAKSSTTTIGKADDPLETEADSVASSVVGALRRQTRNCNCGSPH